MPSIFFSIFILLLLQLQVSAQQGGNAVYGQGYNNVYGKDQSTGKLYLTDSTFLIEANVLMNVIADEYVAVFGLEEEGTTLRDINSKMDNRIDGFTGSIKKLGIAATDMYVDLTTQNKIYDFKISDNIAEQYLKGFEVKKNVAVRMSDLDKLDELMIAASEFQIHDLIKVDYVVKDQEAVYNKLFKECMEVINRKKMMYGEATQSVFKPGSHVYLEKFYSYYPTELYKSYTAYSSSEIYSDAEFVREVRKGPTYYYDKMNYSGFDRIINPSVTEPAVEFVLTLQVMYKVF